MTELTLTAGERIHPPARAAASGGRRTLSGGGAYALVSAVVGLSLLASVTPSPLYGTYARLWHFSALTLTLVYATYAFGVLATLLLAGGASDQVGRKPVLFTSLGVLLVATVLYMVASSVVWLFFARGLQGLATGAALSTASASMLDFHPRRDGAGVARLNGIASAGGVALGALISAAIVEAGVAPRVLPYVVLFVLFAVAFAAATFLPEPVASQGRFRLAPQKPSVPGEVRRHFLLAGMAVLASWSVAGLSFALGPQLSALLFHSTNFVVSALGIVMLGGAAALSAIPTRRLEPWASATVGSVALAAGMVLIVLAAAWTSSAYFVCGSILAGVGFGLAFLGGLRGLVVAIPQAHRGQVMGAFYIVAYASLSVPAVIAGLVVPHLGLATTFELFGSIGAGVALIVTAQAWCTRPARSRRGHPVPAPRQLVPSVSGC